MLACRVCRFDHIFGNFRTAAGKVRRMDIIIAPAEEQPFCVLGWTGSRQYLRFLRQHAVDLRMHLNSHRYISGNPFHVQLCPHTREIQSHSLVKATLQTISLGPSPVQSSDALTTSHCCKIFWCLCLCRLMRKDERGRAVLVPEEAAPLDRFGKPYWPEGWGPERRVRHESDIFELLGIKYWPPHLRNAP
jgi:hypothetical protein